MRRRALLSGSAATLATLPGAVRAQWVDCGGLVPAMVAGPCVPTADLDLTFMVPGSLSPRVTFTRASIGTYFDAAGFMQTAAIDAPRWDYDPATRELRGLLIEEARTNLLLNSATLSTQSVTVTAVAHTLSFYGTGTITKSGTATGALVGTGVAQRVSQTFTPTAGSLTLTVTGTVSNAQIEAGPFVTSYIPVTSVAVTRAFDNCFISSANMSPWFVSPGGTWFAEFVQNVVRTVSNSSPRIIGIHNATAITPLWVTGATNVLATYDGAQIQSVNSIGAGAVSKGASNWVSGNGRLCLNGGAVAFVGTMVTGFATLASAGVSILGGNPGTLNESMTGYIRRVMYWSRILSDAEMQAITS